MTYVYTAAQRRSWLRMILREIRRTRMRVLVESGYLDFGGEAGGA